MNEDIFEPFEKLVEIEILGETRRVPENNSLLRCFQFLAPDTIPYGEFCWNGECANCRVVLAENDKTFLACRTPVKDGMKIVRMSAEIEKAKS